MLNKIYCGGNNLHIFNAVEKDSFIQIEGSAAHFGTPNLNGEIVDAASFDDFFALYQDGKLIPALNYNHDSNMLIGGVDEVAIHDDTLYVRAHINKNIAFCRDTLIPMVLASDVNSYSTEGFCDLNKVKENEDGTYYAGSFILTALAVVTTPADWQSEFTIKNHFEAEKARREEEFKAIHHRKVALLV